MTAKRIIDHFRDAADVELVVRLRDRENPLLGRVTTLGLPESGAERDAVERRYGDFSIGILHDFSPELRGFLLHGGGSAWDLLGRAVPRGAG